MLALSLNGMKLNFWKKDDMDSSVSESIPEDVENLHQSEVSEGVLDESVMLEEVEPADPAKAKLYNDISRWAVLIGVFLMPLFFLPVTTSYLELNKFILLTVVSGVALVSWLLGIVSSGYLAWRPNLMDKGMLVLLAGYGLAATFSMASFNSMFGFVGGANGSLAAIIGFMLIYFLIVNNMEDHGKLLKTLLGLSLAITLLYGLLQIFGVYVLRFAFSETGAFNTVGTVNSLGIIAAGLLPFFSKNRLDSFKIKNAHIEKIGIVVSIAILIILNWWVLWTVAIAGMVAMIVFENIGRSKFKVNKLLLPMTVVILGVFMMVVKLDMSALMKGLPVEIAPSFSLSKDVAVSSLKTKPYFGYGLNNYPVAFDKFGASKLSNTTVSDARFYDGMSEVMTLIVQGGAVMIVSLILFLVSVLFVFWKFKHYALENHGQQFVKEDMGVLASSVALLVALFLYPFNLTLSLLLFVFMGLAVLALFSNRKKEFNIEERPTLSLASSLGFIGGLILVLMGVYFGATTYMGDVKYANALSSTDNEVAANLIVEAINWNGKDSRYYQMASQTALTLLNTELKKPVSAERDSRIQNYVTTSINLARRATEVAPEDTLTWGNLGFIYQNLISIVDGVDKLSEDAYMKASELRPGDPVFAYRIGMLYLGKIDLLAQLVNAKRATAAQINPFAKDAIQKAEENLRKAVELSPNFGLAIYNLGIVYDRQGKINEAVAQLEKIVAANSNQAGLAFELGLLYYRANRKEDAFNQLQRAVLLAPNYANARFYLALIFEERGNLDAAIDQLENILKEDINKDNKVIIDKITELKAGRTTIPPGKVTDAKPLE